MFVPTPLYYILHFIIGVPDFVDNISSIHDLINVSMLATPSMGLVRCLLCDSAIYNVQSNSRMLDGNCNVFLDQLFESNFNTKFKQLNAEILICLFWRLLEGFISTMPVDVSLVSDARYFFFKFIYI